MKVRNLTKNNSCLASRLGAYTFWPMFAVSVSAVENGVCLICIGVLLSSYINLCVNLLDMFTK